MVLAKLEQSEDHMFNKRMTNIPLRNGKYFGLAVKSYLTENF
jgi:hypothetical protein